MTVLTHTHTHRYILYIGFSLLCSDANKTIHFAGLGRARNSQGTKVAEDSEFHEIIFTQLEANIFLWLEDKIGNEI